MSVKRTSAAWVMTAPYHPGMFDVPDGWDRKNLAYSFNMEEIDEVEFRKRLKNSNVRVPEKMSTDLEKPKA